MNTPLRSLGPPGAYFTPMRAYTRLLRTLGLETPQAFFDDPRIHVWRDLRERQNATFDATLSDGESIRLHIKRDKMGQWSGSDREATGLLLLERAGIAAPSLVAAGRLPDGRTFAATLDLAGCRQFDVLVRDRLLTLDAALNAALGVLVKLHGAGLCHRDFYLNHLFASPAEPSKVYLIDNARVGPPPSVLGSRAIVKDIAQLLFSARAFDLTDARQAEMVARYRSMIGSVPLAFERRVRSKIESIARHDRALRKRQPDRNVMIPEERV